MSGWFTRIAGAISKDLLTVSDASRPMFRVWLALVDEGDHWRWYRPASSTGALHFAGAAELRHGCRSSTSRLAGLARLRRQAETSVLTRHSI